MEKTLLTGKEVAEQLKVPVHRIQEFARVGLLKPVHMGVRTNRYTQEEIDRFVKENMEQAAGGKA